MKRSYDREVYQRLLWSDKLISTVLRSWTGFFQVYSRISAALFEVRPYLVPDKNDDIRWENILKDAQDELTSGERI